MVGEFKEPMVQNNLFEYAHERKFMNGILTFVFLIVAAMIILSYFLYFHKLEIFRGTIVESIVDFFKINISNYTLLGAFMLAFFGGLFFVPLPMEILFATFIVKNPQTFWVFTLYMIGLTLGYSTNLFVGYKFSNVSKKLISTKKFYQTKCYVNKYGKFAVFLSNVLPAPSQLVSFILGVFKYNKYKFITQFWAGQTLKLLIITGFVLLFK